MRVYYNDRYLLTGQYTVKGPISEEHDTMTCSPGEVLAGIKCVSTRCDNIYLFCQKPASFVRTDICSHSGVFSEEDSRGSCPVT